MSYLRNPNDEKTARRSEDSLIFAENPVDCDPVGYMEAAARQYRDIFGAKIVGFGDSLLFVSHPQALQQILTNDTKQFTAPGELNDLVRPLLGDNSVALLSGRSHRRQRQLLMPPFHGDRMQI